MSETQASSNLFEANTTHALRGDYASMRADYTVDQNWGGYSEAEHDRWRRLYARQSKLLERYADRTFIEGLRALDTADGVPDFEQASDRLEAVTGWRLVGVPGLIPNDVFFRHLANRRFPVATWIRREDELDYLVEPDVFHDFFGHVPLLSNPTFADYMQSYGAAGLKCIDAETDGVLARLYWYMVEFGLIETDEGLKAYGAGMLSSMGETIFSVAAPQPNRVRFDRARVLTTDYMVDDFQKTYFVIRDYAELFDAMTDDLPEMVADAAKTESIDPATTRPGDDLVAPGQPISQFD
ncbi:MAG: phenylalanine 4-monooxygenase [Pseudomonadota bacterium]